MVRAAGRRAGNGGRRRDRRGVVALTAIGKDLTLPRGGRIPQKGPYAHLHFQVGQKPELACIFGRPGRRKAAGAIPALARDWRCPAGLSTSPQSKPRPD